MTFYIELLQTDILFKFFACMHYTLFYILFTNVSYFSTYFKDSKKYMQMLFCIAPKNYNWYFIIYNVFNFYFIYFLQPIKNIVFRNHQQDEKYIISAQSISSKNFTNLNFTFFNQSTVKTSKEICLQKRRGIGKMGRVLPGIVQCKD